MFLKNPRNTEFGKLQALEGAFSSSFRFCLDVGKWGEKRGWKGKGWKRKEKRKRVKKA